MNQSPLPPGQLEHPSFDRFGLGLFADRLPNDMTQINVDISGDVENPFIITDHLQSLPRTDVVADFHCVTTWSVRDITWSGVRFIDVYEQLVLPLARPRREHSFVVLQAADKYRVSMQLRDLLKEDVLLADSLNGQPLGADHGAPLRLVAPKHYGYKNIKHLSAIHFQANKGRYRFPFPYPNFMDHPRGRVDHEERAAILPNWLIRPLYRLLQPGARSKHAKALANYQMNKGIK